LSKKYNVPLILDYRDGWTTNTLHNISFFDRILNALIFKRLEKLYTQNASLILTAAPVYKKQLSNIVENDKINVIFNGYFSEYYKNIISLKTKIFTVSYAGIIYPYQPVEIFLNGVVEFLNKMKVNLCLNFFGLNFYEEQIRRVEIYKTLNPYINFTNRVPQEKLVHLLNNSDLFLLLANPEEERLAAKIFEYLSYKKKILMVLNDNGIMEDILKQTNSGIICNSSAEVVTALTTAYDEWLDKGYVNCNSKNIEQFSRRNQTKQLATLLNGLN